MRLHTTNTSSRPPTAQRPFSSSCAGARGQARHNHKSSHSSRQATHERAVLCRATPSNDDDSASAEPQLFGDWREFRAKLVLGQDKAQQQSLSEENLKLLEIQNPKLAQEGIWAHATAQVEKGGLLLATPDNPRTLGTEMFWQAVILVVQHSAQGTVGLLLNRPTGMVMRPGKGGLRYAIIGAPEGMQTVFGDNRVYCGGVIRQDVFHLLHGHNLEGAVEVVPGVYTGGEAAAVQAVQQGLLSAGDFKFFAGAVMWLDGELEQELAKGAWWTAAASRPIVLKQCLQLPKPLWKEVCECMGGEYAAAAREDVIE